MDWSQINTYIVIFWVALVTRECLTQSEMRSTVCCNIWNHQEMSYSEIFKVFLTYYTLSHPENDRDVTEHAMRQSRCSFLNAWDNTQVARAMTSVFTRNTRWRHGCSRGETKYRCMLSLLFYDNNILYNFIADLLA